MNSTFQIGETLWLRNPLLAGTAHAEMAVTFRGRIDADRSVVSPVQPGMDFDATTAHLFGGTIATTAHLSSEQSNADDPHVYVDDDGTQH
jgi:hypothetical protein